MTTVREWMESSRKMLNKRNEFPVFEDENGTKKSYEKLTEADKNLEIDDYIGMMIFGPVVYAKGCFEDGGKANGKN